MLIGVIGMVVGAAFIVQGVMKYNLITGAMRLEKVTLGDVHVPDRPADEIIDSSSEAQAAGDTIRAHRRQIAPSYEELLAGGRYDPTNPKHLTYAQALNMENYLYLAVAGFGLIYVVLASGLFMIMTGAGTVLIGFILLKMNKAE